MTSRCAKRASNDVWPGGHPTAHGRGVLHPIIQGTPASRASPPAVPGTPLIPTAAWTACGSERAKAKPCLSLDGARLQGKKRNLTSGACFDASLSSGGQQYHVGAVRV
ncbi:hypothetical protein NDU88_007782 [Pleurodeles waltl]|uniref:Uncharacterized protein n=1 Tax=Pleurodeles waltl TaxID=8319 RepID=A0AAV7NXI9_PLEWA|nr:hypothetical protein NDU88_007782 [Pleurodeles waltl]